MATVFCNESEYDIGRVSYGGIGLSSASVMKHFLKLKLTLAEQDPVNRAR